MKSILPGLVIAMVAAAAFTGCGSGNSSDTANSPATNSSMMETNGMSGVNTNPPATNGLPDMNTNTPPGTNQ